MKKTVSINGKVAFPLEVGCRAVIRRGSDFAITSPVVEIREQRADFVCFETMNSIYQVSLAPEPVEVSASYPMMRAA
jgi:hypothetical protein